MKLATRLGSTAFAALLVKGAAAAFGLLANVVITRALGAEASGLYFLALTVVGVALVFGRAGTDMVVLSSGGAAFGAGSIATLRRVVAWALRRTAVSASVLSALLWLAAPLFETWVFGAPGLAQVLRIVAVAVAASSLMSVWVEASKSVARVVSAMAVQSLILPVVSLGLIGGWWLLRGAPGLPQVSGAYLAANLAVAIVAAGLWQRVRPKPLPSGSAADDAKEQDPGAAALRASATTFVTIALLNVVIDATDTVMIGIMLRSEDVGLYSAALRMAALSSLVLTAVNGVVGPRFAALHGAGDAAGLRRLTAVSVRGMSLLAAVILMLYLLLRVPIMAMFGPEFVAAVPAFTVLAFGQFVALATGPVAYLLMMTGHAGAHRATVVVAAVANLLLNLLLIPLYGIVGAAMATALSLILKNAVAFWWVRQRLGFWPFQH